MLQNNVSWNIIMYSNVNYVLDQCSLVQSSSDRAIQNWNYYSDSRDLSLFQ